MQDVLIIGGGPAGLTAGLYAARAGFSVTILEKLLVGGQVALTSKVENYPGFADGIGGPELCIEMEQQAKRAGAVISYQGALEIDCAGRRARTNTGWYDAKALILALGAYPKKLGVVGEDQYVGRGVSFCATCDGALYRGKRVAVIGGGNSAAEEALYLSGIGCEVLLVHRRDALRAETKVAEEVLASPAITVLWNSQVEALQGDGKLTTMRLHGGRTEAIEAAFVSVGRTPNTSLLRGQLPMNPQGFVLAKEDCSTGMDGVFAVGDMRAKGLRQIVTAISDGAIAVSGIRQAFV